MDDHDVKTPAPICAHELAHRLDFRQAELVDVREPAQYSSGHIPGAILDPLSRFDPERYREHGHQVVFCCDSGEASAEAARRLLDCGASHAMHLEGGLASWRACGFPLVPSATDTGESHGTSVRNAVHHIGPRPDAHERATA
jgi:rhodanese-related sulfurtransferase